jgi:UDP-N-acetylglucosamine--N-acetylmuramyl-(pentapeptide) pyrophosphoryl-undecaprenol N-acetylglucosamine transferase
MKTVVFTGGGTGGHIYPGLAVVDELKEKINSTKIDGTSLDVKIVWIGSSKGMDKNLVEKSGSVDKFIGIPCGKLRRYFSFQNFIDLFKIAAGFISAFFHLAKLKPLVVFSKGGFVSVPSCYAAKLLKIPVFTHECDFSTGLATRLNLKVAEKLLVSYEETKNKLPSSVQEKTIVTGNPVRPIFYNADKNKGIEFVLSSKNESSKQITKPILLVVGGSLGAKQINLLVWKNLEELCKNYIVIHQTGKKQDYFVEVSHSDYYPFEFIYSQMADVMACADVILSRSGANSLWESVVQYKPMVLIPLSVAGSRGDQVENAKYFEQKGCAINLDSENLTDEVFLQTMTDVLSEQKRQNMIESCKSVCGNFKPAEKIASIVFEKIIK